MSRWTGSLRATGAGTAAAALATVPLRAVVHDCGEPFPDCGTALEAADFSWSPE